MTKKAGAQGGTRAIDKVRAAYRNRRRKEEVPEWDMTLYFGPLTTADNEAVDLRMQDEDGLDPEVRKYDRRIYLLIHKAELEDGSRAFDFGDFHYLKNEADFMVLSRLWAVMFQGALQIGEDVEAAKKKSEETGSSGSD